MAIDFTGLPMDNLMLSKVDAPLGTYRQSDLTLAQFQANSVGTWVLANGGSCAGSAYESLTGKSTVPDMRATVPRMKDNARGLNPDGDLTLGAYQADQFGTHTHVQNSHNHTQDPHYHGGVPNTYVSSPGVTNSVHNELWQSGYTTTNYATATNQATIATNQNSGGNETRMKSTTVNFFIKIGY